MKTAQPVAGGGGRSPLDGRSARMDSYGRSDDKTPSQAFCLYGYVEHV